MKNKCISALLCIAVMLSVFPAAVQAYEMTEVYTEFTGGNSNHAGNGTKESPYNLFTDALEAVSDGGTIYIGSGAFVNEETDGQPLKITKNVTIIPCPDMAYRPSMEIRKGGLVLGANVTFRNIVLSFSNARYAAIFANGYTLTLDNVSYSQNARVIHLAGGGLYDSCGTSLSPEPGEHSHIIINGRDTCFGNIYAGSMNGDFDREVDIEISGVSGSNIGNIYASGAKEGYYNSQNFLDPYNEPEAPVPNALLYPVTEAVSVTLTNSSMRLIDGETGGNKNASLTVSNEYRYECDLNNIGSLTVNEGTFAPKSINDDVNVYIQSEGVLDMSSISQCTVGDFYSYGGILILDKNDCLTISGLCTGNTEFRTSAGSRYTSGIAEYNHMYIKTEGDGEFEFNPYSTQPDMELNKTDNGWQTSSQTESLYKTVLKSFDIAEPAVIATESQVNGMAEQNTVVGICAEFTEDTDLKDISVIPFEYSVTYKETAAGPVKSTETQDGYVGIIPGLSLNFWQETWDEETHSITVINWSSASPDTGHIDTGIYDIEITAPTDSGNVTRSVRLTVIADETEGGTDTQTIVSVSKNNISYNGSLDVQADIKSDGNAVTEGSAVLYINGKPYSDAAAIDENGTVQWQDIPVTFENGFKIQSNLLTVRYGGSEKYKASQSDFSSLNVDKAMITINHSGKNTEADYTGRIIETDFGEFTFTDENGAAIYIDAEPEISYTDEGGNTVNPIMPGIYTSNLSLPEGDFYYSVTNQPGTTLTVNSVEPSVILDITYINDCEIKLTAEVGGCIGGRIPTGNIEIADRNDGEVKETASLNGGSAEILLSDLTYGEYKLYAVYKPDTSAPYKTAESAEVSFTVDEPVRNMWEVNGTETGNIDVTFTNLTDKNIDNAVIIIAAYDAEDILKRLEISERGVNTAIGEKQDFSFDLSGSQYETIKIFVWSSLDKAQPECENYIS